MCMSSPAPATKTNVVTPPPAAAPQPLALAESTSGASSLQQLRVGTKSNLKLRVADAPTSGLTIPAPGTTA